MLSAMWKEQEFLQAVRSGDIQGLTRILAKYKQSKPKLLGSGKRVNVNVQENDGMSALHQAALMCNVPIMQLLLDHGAQVDIKDNKGMRPLHYASWQGKPEPVALLLQYNSSVNDPASDGETPLHLACQHGHVDVTTKLLNYHANPSLRNKEHKTPLDLACEFGRYKVVELLLQTARCQHLLEENPQDTADNSRTTCLHLAARNGHTDVIRLLLRGGVDINRSTLRGTALHEAAMHGKLEAVKLLIESGIDVNKPNSYDQTALDIVRSFSTCNAAREMKLLLKEAINAVPARAIKDYYSPSDANSLPLKEGELVQVLEQSADGRWKGIIFRSNHTSQTGYFPATAVQLLDRPVGGMQRTGTLKGSSMKKVPPPVVPDLTHRHSGSSFSSGYGSQTTDRSSCGSLGNEDFGSSGTPTSPRRDSGDYVTSHCRLPGPLPSPTRPPITTFCFPDAHTHYTQVVVHARPNSHPSTPEETTPPMGFPSALSNNCPGHLLATQVSLEDQGIDVGRESPSGSSGSSCTSGVSSSSSTSSGGSRHSTSSLDSGRASASGSDGKGAPSQHRLSVQSCESVGSSQRPSCHSSNSSLGSLDRLEETSTPSSTTSSSGSSTRVHVAEMVLHGIHDEEILRAWLSSLHFEEYSHMFIQAGYDMPTISRMTPEDLTAIGITKPAHRRKLKAEIAKLNISDGIPDYKPDSLLEWLRLLRLEEYFDTLCHQGYDTVDRVTELTWEDLEEIGIQKLGHQKKIMLAIKRVKDINNGVARRPQHFIPEPHMQPLDIPVGSGATLPRPSAMSHIHPTSMPYPFGQEVVITTSRAKTYSPTSDTGNIPEFKTFQQSPPKNDGFRYTGFNELHSPTHPGSFFQDNVIIQVRSPNRGRSLESLGMDDSVSTHAHYPFHGGSDCWYDTVSASRQHGYDTDSELSVHSGDSYVLYEPDGTATLHRPRGMVKPRPVAKIVAKTRRAEQQQMDYPPEDAKAQVKALQEHLDGWSSLEGSPRHGTLSNRPTSGSPANQNYGTLKGKRNPPPPPKRTNSIKSDHHPNPPVPVERSLEAMQDQAFATCVKSLASRFNMATSVSKEEDLPPPPMTSLAAPMPPAGSEDFPPPPSPLPLVQVDKTDSCANIAEQNMRECGSNGGGGDDGSVTNSAKELVQFNELQNNPLFRARRKDSADSNISTSSTESNSLPFANENVGTIKQRAAKPHPSLVAEGQSPTPSPSSTLRRTSLPSVLGSKVSSSRRGECQTMERALSGTTLDTSNNSIGKSSATSGDVIDDIENMLANLSNQLDAMLESEINGQ